MVYIGSTLSSKQEENAKLNPVITEGIDAIGTGVPDEQKTPQQKENAKKILEVNRSTTKQDLDKVANALNLPKSWDVTEKQDDGIPILRQYFPKGQSINAWREALVFRSFVNIKVKDATPLVYEIYEEWLKNQIPDLQMNHNEENGGVVFSGYSNAGKLYICGKIYQGTLGETIYIAQYIIKNDGKQDVEHNAKTWNNILANIR